MSTFVLVHGAWGGSYAFAATRRLLQAEGHEVFTPSLTGIGERAHLGSPQVNLTTHIADIVNSVLYEDLTDIVLLGYSYGGFVITGALDHVADRISQLVYLDAFVPNDGEALCDLVDQPGADFGPGSNWLLPPLAREYESPEIAAFSEARRVPHPIGCFMEPVSVTKPVEEFGLALAYIKATGEPRAETEGPFWVASDRAKESAAWTHHEIDSNHMIPSNRPQQLAAILASLVA